MSDYHTDTTAITRSQLVEFMDSREVYAARFVHKTMPRKTPTKQMDVGTIVHKCLLEQGRVDDCIAVYPESCLKSNGAINPTPAREFEDRNSGRIAMKESDADNVRAIVSAAMKSELGPVLDAATAFETDAQATLYGRLCKCKPDIVSVMSGACLAYDLKVGVMKSGQFRRNARSLKLWMQDAHYSAILTAIHRTPVVFRFAVIESEPPHRVRFFWYDDASRETARDEHQRVVESLVECERTGEWIDEQEPILVLSPWEVNSTPIELDWSDNA